MSTNAHSTGPLTATPLFLEIEKIKLYAQNPCREIDPKYAKIKASIRAQRRLNDPLSITRRPDDDLYMVESGDNTRLKILKELWREIRDQSFQTIHCLFVPWISERRILSPHIVENELRGDRTFIDKALGLINLKRQLEKEQGKALSRSECQRRLSDIGCTVSRRQMIRLNYAAEFSILFSVRFSLDMTVNSGIPPRFAERWTGGLPMRLRSRRTKFDRVSIHSSTKDPVHALISNQRPFQITALKNEGVYL